MKKIAKKIISIFKYIPRWVFVLLPILIVTVTYIINYVIPKPIQYSFAGTTCIKSSTLAPSLTTVSSSDKFTISYKDTIKLGSFDLYSGKTCFTPTVAPKSGEHVIVASPLGGALFRTSFKIVVPETPEIASVATNESIALGRPLRFKLSQPDATFSYGVTVGDSSTGCQSIDSSLSCALDTLKLEQGKTYAYKLARSFRGKDTVELINSQFTTIPAIKVIDSSVKSDQIIYNKPTEFTINTDKAISSARVSLNEIDGTKTTPLATSLSHQGTVLTIKPASELQRQKTFRLSIESIVASDDSMLASPVSIGFNTSGGPKITGVNIGYSGVAENARIIVQFDQSIRSDIDPSRYASIAGGSATISKTANQIIYTLKDMARCQAFTLNIAKGIIGADNDMASSSTWSHSSRTNCRSSSVIGYSVRGKPIVAYYYGSGPTTILFTGGIHGSEPSGKSTLDSWVAHLDNNAHKIPAGRQVVVVPNTNPDGITANSRYNANGVNLGRNFPTANWQSDIDTSGGPKPGGGGSTPLSEPEAKALHNLTASLRPRLMISYHAQGRLVGANRVADANSIAATYASSVGYKSMIGIAEEVMGYTITGEYEEWMGEKLGLPAILIELPTASGSYFGAHQSIMWRMVGI